MTLRQEVTTIGIVISTVSVQKTSDKFAKKVQVTKKWHKGTEAKITVQTSNRWKAKLTITNPSLTWPSYLNPMVAD